MFRLKNRVTYQQFFLLLTVAKKKSTHLCTPQDLIANPRQFHERSFVLHGSPQCCIVLKRHTANVVFAKSFKSHYSIIKFTCTPLALSNRLPSLKQFAVHLGSGRRSKDLCNQKVEQVLVQRHH